VDIAYADIQSLWCL